MGDEIRIGLGYARRPFVVLGIVLGFFMLVPLIIVVPTSWTSDQLLEFPPKGFSLQWYEQAFADDTWTGPFWTSVKISFQASILATIMGTATALGMRRLAVGRSTNVMRSLFILPLALPYVSYALGVYQLFLRMPEPLADSTLPLAMSQATITFPLVYVVVAGALSMVDQRLTAAAATMGARWPTILWKIELPLIRVAILGGWIFAFATCFDEATLAIFLSPVEEVTLAQQIFREASESIAPTLSAVSTMITLLAIAVLGIGSLIMRRMAAPSRGGGAA
ncbi:ABC transporter permease [Patulibacter defluvii]|uniref:ABC transporter permease n=1 Tax=Patulibacter defluvii TaxID=3095358 RepID=UPI002A74A79E|nr:ABC transporter permease [Patulibacter sp. DM4]